MQERIKEHDKDIQLARTQTSAVSEHDHETGLGTRPSILIEILNGTHLESRKLFTHDFTLITSTRIVELKFLKHGFPRSKNTTTGKRHTSGRLREQLVSNTMEQWEDQNALITANRRNINGAV